MIRKTTPERLSFFSDAIFAVLITVLVLGLHPPERPTFEAFLELWPTWLSYAVSYLFIAIVWANHHHLIHVLERGNGGSRTARCTGGCGNPCETRSRVSRRLNDSPAPIGRWSATRTAMTAPSPSCATSWSRGSADSC